MLLSSPTDVGANLRLCALLVSASHSLHVDAQNNILALATHSVDVVLGTESATGENIELISGVLQAASDQTVRLVSRVERTIPLTLRLRSSRLSTSTSCGNWRRSCSRLRSTSAISLLSSRPPSNAPTTWLSATPRVKPVLRRRWPPSNRHIPSFSLSRPSTSSGGRHLAERRVISRSRPTWWIRCRS